jgi:hypothetical protein
VPSSGHRGTVDTMTTAAVRLINCTEHPVHVRVDGDVVALPTMPAATIVDDPRSQPSGDTLTVTVDGEHRCQLDVRDGPVQLTIGLPPPVDGVAYLVDNETLLRAPHRTDFVVADTYDAGRDGPSVLLRVRRRLAAVERDTPELDRSPAPVSNRTADRSDIAPGGRHR